MSIPGVPNSPSGMPMRRQVKRDTTEFEDYLSGQSYVAHVSFAFRSGLDGHNYESEPDAFADWIRDHLFLESIDLRGIEPTKDEVLIKIGKGLAGNRSIACLNFTHNNLGQKDVRGFLLALAENVSIWRLELHKNQIDVNGAKAIAEFMRENVGVTHLNLSHNPLIGEEGARHILEAFAENGSIYVMKLAGCNCGEELLAAINRCCRRNRAAVAYKMEADAPQENKEDDAEDAENEEEEEEEEDAQGDPDRLEGEVAAEGEEGGKSKKAKKKRSIGSVTAKDDTELLPMETIYVLTDQKKREQERLDDATFYEFLAEYLDALLVDSRNFESEEKKALANIERDSAAFASREKEHVQKIKDLEGGIFELSKEMLVCRKMLELDKVKQKKLKESRLELLQLMASEEETFSEKVEKLELELKCVEKERVNYEVQTNIVLKDLDIVKTENKKLRAHIRKFQEDISEIVGQ